MIMNSKVYDILNVIVKTVLPALATFYATLAELWHLPYPIQIVGTISAVAAFLGVFIEISKHKYNAEMKTINSDMKENDIPGE